MTVFLIGDKNNFRKLPQLALRPDKETRVTLSSLKL